ncbi:MAG: Verru_Chthon cassette protein D [Verrucomicrobiota bacterium]
MIFDSPANGSVPPCPAPFHAKRTPDFPVPPGGFCTTPRPIKIQKAKFKNPPLPAFTLIELLVVMTIIAVLITLIAPSFNSILGASHLGVASETVLGVFSSARQLATAKNRVIEVRLLCFKNPDFPNSSASQIRGIQLMQIEENGAYNNIEKPRLFPNGIISGISPVISSLASGTANTPTSTDPSISTIGKNYTYYKLRIRPDGSFDLGNLGLPGTVTSYYLTLYDEKIQPSGNTPPPNFATIQIVPRTGDTILYRP